MNIKDFMICKEGSIKEAMKVMDKNRKYTVFVVDNDKLIGVVTDGDIRRSIFDGVDVNDNILTITNTNPVLTNSDVYTNDNTMLIPRIDENNKIIDIYNIDNYTNIHRVLLIGGAGFLGSVLSRKLLDKGYVVRVLDNLMYGDQGIVDILDNDNFEFIKGDIRNLEVLMESIKDVNTVIHLAAIVGDPASSIYPKKTIEINWMSTKLIADICKYCQINRFIFASTCSVYGESIGDNSLNEESETNPVSLYARMKLKSENTIKEISDENFSPTILRMGTLYGLSPRMRFDLVVNLLVIKGLIDYKYSIFGGDQYRGFCNIEDAADAYISCIECPLEIVKNKIFNISNENLKIIELGELIKEHIDNVNMIVDKSVLDKRNYSIDSSKFCNELKFDYNKKIIDFINDFKKCYKNYGDYNNPIYNNYKWLNGDCI